MFKYFGPLVRQYAVVTIVNLTALSFGIGSLWPSPILVKLRNETQPVLSRPITEEEGSWIVSIGGLTSIFTNFIVAYSMDQIGRKYCIMLQGLLKLLTGLIFIFATEVWMVVFGRAILGIADVFGIVVTTYATEIASKEIRGGLGTIFQVFSSLGVVIILSIGPFTSYWTINTIYTCITFATIIPVLILPESPFFLYSKGSKDETVKVLTFLRGSELKASEELKEYSLATTDVQLDKRQLFINKTFLKCLGIVIVFGFGNQAVGFNAVMFYLQTVLETTQTSVQPETASVIVSLIQLAASICTMVSSDRFGRKPILAVTLIGMAVGMIGLGAFFKLLDIGHPMIGFLNFMPLISLILITFCYSGGLGAIYWMMITEFFEGPSRAIGVSASILTTDITLFLTTKYFYFFTTSLGPALTYWIFSVNCFLLCLFIIFFVPETKKRTFAEIQEKLGAKKREQKLSF